MEAVKSQPVAMLVFALCCSCLAAALGCGGGKDDDASSSAEENLKDPDCQAITQACHDADDGNGEVSKCHTTAHADQGPACKQARVSCLALCAAK